MASTWRIVHLFAVCIVCHATSQPATQVGHVRTRSLNEASGLVMSRKHPGVYWTHNDGGDGVLYAIAADGSTIGKITIDANRNAQVPVYLLKIDKDGKFSLQ